MVWLVLIIGKELFHSVAKGICDRLQIYIRQFDSDHYVHIKYYYMLGVTQLVRVPDCDSGCCEFESRLLPPPGTNMYYTIYEIKNIINDKVYIGKHKTADLDDTYMGSGKILKHAINKYGIDNFTKTYLFIFDNEEDMNNKELELVSEEFIKEDTNYNLKLGGEGGWDYNNHPRNHHLKVKAYNISRINNPNGLFFGKTHSNETKKKISIKSKQRYKENPGVFTFLGRTHSDETKAKMRKPKNVGKENSQYGTMWIHSLELKVSKRINKNDDIPEGWYKGRKMKFK